MVDEGARVVSQLDGDAVASAVAVAGGDPAAKAAVASSSGDVLAGDGAGAAPGAEDFAYPSNNPFAAPSLFHKPAFDVKPEGFVLTSDLKLNFLTKASEERPGKSTGAVPKRVVAAAASNDTASVDPFVRPASPGGPKSDDGSKTNYQKSTSWEGNHSATLTRLKLENDRLHREIEALQRKLNARKNPNSSSTDTPESPSGEESPEQRSRVRELEDELDQAKEAIASLKVERKKLKSEKLDLLNQMKQLYSTLDDKEKELRDFIRNYEQRMRDNESSLQRLSTEREERERERWSLLRHARDEAERSLSLAAQLAAKDAQIQQLQDNLDDARRQTTGGCLSDQESLASMSLSRINGSTGGMTPTGGPPAALGLLPGDRGSCSADSGVRGSSDRESGGATSVGGNLSDSTTDGPLLVDGSLVLGTPTITAEQQHARLDLDSVSLASSVNTSHVYQTVSTPKDCSPSLSPLNAAPFSRSVDNSSLSRSVEQLCSPMEEPRRKTHHSRLTGRGGAWGSISRVFTRSRHRKVSSPSSQEESAENYRSWSPLTEEGYAEKLRLLREAATIPMERWRAPLVLAWLEIALGMPQYGPRCAENIKSGKVLLELSDLELECGLGMTHPMHRKKLRLAIEEHRHPSLVRYPCIAQLGHTWVSSEWLPDLGLAQYSENFAANMVDARMLDHLSKKELEKFLGVTRKFHQASIVHGIHLLRMMKYDRQALAVRRHQCEAVDADPLVWTNQRFIKWARNIDLCEYSDNLKDSGVHGALVVLEPSFNGDTMATALGIPPAKNIIRRHLAAELETLVLPARYVIFCQMEEYQAEVARAVNNVKHIQRGSLRKIAGSMVATQLQTPQDPGQPPPAPPPKPPDHATPTRDWRGVWRDGVVTRYRDLVRPIQSGLEAGTDPAYWKTIWRGSINRRRSHVQPLQSPTDSVVSDINFRVSSPPDFAHRSPTQSLSGTVRRACRRHRRAKSYSEIPVA